MDLHLDREKNFDGYRDRNQFTKFAPVGKKCIIFLGDSFTAGQGIKRIDDRFTDRIAADLELKAPGRYMVANLGEAGDDVQEIGSLMHNVIVGQYDTSIAIYVYNLNDIDRLSTATSNALGDISHTQPHSRLFKDTYLLNWLYFRAMEINRPGVKSYYDLLAQSYQSDEWRVVRNILTMMHRECVNAGIDFRLVIFPFMQNLGDNYRFRNVHAQIVEFCHSEKIPVLDLEPVFRQHAGESVAVSRFDSHPNEHANAIAAEAIEKDLLFDVFQSAPLEKDKSSPTAREAEKPAKAGATGH
jgi:lysophospholipase L1-like esterase